MNITKAALGLGLVVLAFPVALPQPDERRSDGETDFARPLSEWSKAEANGLFETPINLPPGVPFEYSFDFKAGHGQLVPMPAANTELPGPEGDCLMTQWGVGWIVPPPGIQAQGDCNSQAIFDGPVGRVGLACVSVLGSCGVLLEGDMVGRGGPGLILMVCNTAPAAALGVWIPVELPMLGPPGCSTTIFGNLPFMWDIWWGRVGSFPPSPSDPGASFGAVWRPES